MVRATQQWRRHSFFRKTALGDATKQLGLPEGAQVTCAHLVELKPRRDEDAITMQDVDEATTKQLKEPSIKALVVVGDNGGRVVVCDGHLTSPSFLPPFDSRSLHVHAVTRGSEKDVAQVGAVVAAVGSCRDGSYLLRTFAVSDDGAFAGGVAELPLTKDAPASLALRSDGRLCAIGLESGTVTLVSVGASIACSEDDLSRNPVAPGDKPRLVDFADAAARRIGRQLQTDKADELLVACGSVKPPRSAPCVALAFASLSEETYLFVGSQVRRFAGDRVEGDSDDDDDAGGQVVCAQVPETISGTLPSSVLDERGCGPGLMSFDGEKVIVARSDGLYLYATDERRGALGFDGPKTALACLGDGLVAVAAVGRYKRSEVTIYDIIQRRIVHFARLQQGVAAACLLAALSRKPPEPADWIDGRRPLMKPLASVVMLSTDGGIVRYDEKSTPEKLDGLYKERSYASAVDIALKSGLPKRAAAQIFRMYGDHLCDQSQYGDAAIQYAHTIGTVPPSYVIQRFLNARRFEELASYLLKAHGKDETKRQFVLDDPYGYPRPIEELDQLTTRPELTTLLINCYAKLKDVAALDRFVRNEDDLAVDGATAVVALRDAGYYNHAEKAAVAFEEWAWRCVLALERDPWRPEEALEFFDRMDVLSRFRCVRRFGIRLVKDYPDRTTELLMRLATAPDIEVDDCVRPEDENTPVCYEEELQLRKEEARQKNRPTTPQAFPPDSDSDDEGFTCDDFPHFFVHRPGHLRLFCDYVMNFDERGRTRNICTTLCELLIDEWRSLKDNDGSEELLEQKSEDIMALLRSDAPYDRMVALVLVETREFPPGTLYLYETKFAQEPVPYTDRKEPWWTRRQKRRSQKFRDAIRPEERVIPHGLRNGILVQEYHKRGRIGDMLRICRAEGRSDPLLWVLACQTTAGAIPPEVLKRKRYFGLGDDKAEVWDPEAAREADEHTARCANEGYAAEGFVDSDYAKMYAPKPPPPPPPPPTDPEILRKLDEREDRCSDLKEVLKALDEEKGLHPRRVVELVCQNENVPLGAMLPYLKTVLGRWHAETEAENKESRRLEKECAAMRRELHDSKCAEVAALPNVNEYADVLQMPPGPEKTQLLDEILEEKYKIDEEAADRWREEEGLPPLSKEDREALLDKIMSEDDRKWMEIHKKRQEPVDHEQFFRELEDPETGGFDCVARWIGKGVISDDAPIDVDALKKYPYIVGEEVAQDDEGRYLINVAPALRPYVQEPEKVGRGTVELDDPGVAESKG